MKQGLKKSIVSTVAVAAMIPVIAGCSHIGQHHYSYSEAQKQAIIAKLNASSASPAVKAAEIKNFEDHVGK
jgi:hypothetical protein